MYEGGKGEVVERPTAALVVRPQPPRSLTASTPPCSMRASTSTRSQPCIASWPVKTPCANGATSCGIRSIQSRSCRPEFPDRFGSYQDAHGFCRCFIDWYNTEHHHSGIGLHTPENVHYGGAGAPGEARQRTLLAAYAAHPERFVRKLPAPPSLPEAVWINPQITC
jgi:hypothetical protein